MEANALDALVIERRNIPGYKDKQVYRELLAEIIAVARGAPASHAHATLVFQVVTGKLLDRIRAGNTAKTMFDAIVDRKIKVNHGYECAYHQRKVDIAKQLFAIMGIAREDTEKQQNWVMRGFRQFDASISIVMTCIAMGWPDFDLADNDAKPVREDNENFVTYTSFE